MLLERKETYRCNTQPEVEQFIDENKQKAKEEGYVLKTYSSQLKEKTSKGEVIDSGYLVTLVKVFGGFWD